MDIGPPNEIATDLDSNIFIDRFRNVNEPLPQYADVDILGGGVTGCNTLYQLTKLGLTNSVIIEKNQITSGTTWHSAGKSC